MAWRCNNNFGGTIMKAWIDDNNKLNINFGKFDASCKDGVWTVYLPVNAPSGNKLRKENARYEYVGTITFDKDNPFEVKTFYITDKKETNP
tara:strand:+ start:131 stop:403 length:273 start_codon:yes stop_codon:yes gene_type:complete